MIPNKIHYCWFGRNPLPKSAQKCIASWRKYFPGYEIIEWNEDNYDVNKIPYTQEAYQAKKYAFVSDYARFDILYHEGGIYFDTDVEVIKPFDDILQRGAFMGCEIDGAGSLETERIHAFDSYIECVTPGLGIAAAPGLRLYKEILDFYARESFIKEDGSINTETVVTKTTKILLERGLKDIKGIQKVEDITIYPKEYFNPKDSRTSKLEITDNTHSIHWYSMSWMTQRQRLRNKILKPFHRVFGPKCFSWVKRFFGK
jgi:mannosyltransferase OCH1-like enzyme